MPDSSERTLEPRKVLRCPRCEGVGVDPRLTDQSCLVCWGKRTIDPWRQSWDGQHAKIVEHLLCGPDAKWIDDPDHEGDDPVDPAAVEDLMAALEKSLAKAKEARNAGR